MGIRKGIDMWFWRRQPLLRNFVSDLDQFLLRFDKKPEASNVWRLAEEKEYQKIAWLRDNPNPKDNAIELWQAF